MRGVSRVLYQALRGGGAVVEGAEFLLTHRHLLRRQIGHFLAAAACAVVATWLGARLAMVLPAAPAIAFPWYLVLIEWLWAELPSVLAAEVAGWGAGTVYLALPFPRQLVWVVMSQRGGTAPTSPSDRERERALIWLGAGAAGCVLVAWVPVVGPPAAAVLACPVLGGGFVVAILTLRGWPGARRPLEPAREQLLMLGQINDDRHVQDQDPDPYRCEAVPNFVQLEWNEQPSG
jgi:hypothetical protein